MPITTSYILPDIKAIPQKAIKGNKIKGNKTKVELTPEQQLNALTKKSTETLSKIVKEQVPDKGRFYKGVSVSFDIPASNNRTVLVVEESAENKHENRDLLVGVKHKQRDKLLSKLLLNRKSKNDIIKYLLDSANQVIIIKNIKDLSKSTDDYYSKL